MTKYSPRLREAPPRGVFAHLGSMFDQFGVVFRPKFFKSRTTIVKLRTNFVLIIEKRMTDKVPMIFHINVVVKDRSSLKGLNAALECLTCDGHQVVA